MKRTKSLDSIHLDEDLFIQYVNKLTEYGQLQELTISVSWNGSSATFHSAESLIDEPSIPDRILAFNLQISMEEGTLEVRADSRSNKEIHSLTIEGEDEWVRTTIHNIDEFFEVRGNRIKPLFSNKRILLLQLLAGGIVFSLLGRYIVAFIVPLIHIEIPQEILILSFATILPVVFLEGLKRSYPFVVLHRKGEEPIFRTAIFAILTVISFVGDAYALFRTFGGTL